MNDSAARTRAILAVCSAAALLEGFDNQSVGVAAPMMMRELGLLPAQSGWIFSAGTLGAVAGALFGGRLADRHGRKRALIVSMWLFGIASLATPLASTAKMLFICRLITGIGLGGAMPNFITLACEAVRVEMRLRTGTLIMSALPLGGALAAVTAAHAGPHWRTIFYLGGGLPVMLAVAASWALSRDIRRREIAPSGGPAAQAQNFLHALFAPGTWLATVLLWISFFFTQLILLLMLNWLPSLLVKLGFSAVQASWLAVCFGASGALGSVVLGYLQSGRRRKWWVVATYAGISVALAAISMAQQALLIAIVTCSIAGAFVIGAQLTLFGLAPLYYSRKVRGTGVGSAVAVGRAGSVIGPLFAGTLLGGGGSAATVLLAIEPFVLIGGIAAFALCWRAPVHD